MIDTNKIIAIAESLLSKGAEESGTESLNAEVQGAEVQGAEESGAEEQTTKSRGVTIGTDLFVVGCTCNTANEVELLIDSDTKVSIDDCITLSRAIEAEFDREVEDFQLTVASAGIGSEIKLLRQYPKLIGRSVEVLMKDGVKVIGELREATEQAITVAYEKRVVVENASGKKKKQVVEQEDTLNFDEIKYVKEFLDFK